MSEWDGLTVEQARPLIAERAVDGTHCPCCQQFCKVYRRPITSTMAAWLIQLVRRFAQEPRWYSVSERWSLLANRGTGDVAKLEHWDLIRSCPNDDKSKRTSGLWQPTADGVNFAHARTTLPRWAILYDGKLLRLDGPQVGIERALGRRFDYGLLMMGQL